MTKKEAMATILKVLRSMMAVKCKPWKEEALTLAEEHGITVKDLIEEWNDMANRV
jgi:hypothetical protein